MAETNALMGMAHVMKPFWRFEYWYDRVGGAALSGASPIHLGPSQPVIPANGAPPASDLAAFDIAARNGDAGYASRLASMLPVSQIGSDLLIYIPDIPGGDPEQEVVPTHCYIYVPIWRLRTVRDWNDYRKQGHIYKESFGPSSRYILPASSSSALLSNALLDMPHTYDPFLSLSNMFTDGIVNRVQGGKLTPLGPGTGASLEVQQGVLDTSAAQIAYNPLFRHYWTKASGDEFAFWVYKAKFPLPGDSALEWVDWDFNYDPATGYCDPDAEDIYFSVIYGVGADPATTAARFHGSYPFTGLYVMTGVTSG